MNIKNILPSTLALFLSALSSDGVTIITSNSQVVDGVTVNIGSAWVYNVTSNGFGGTQTDLDGGTDTEISFVGLTPGQQVIFTVSPTESSGSARTWNGTTDVGPGVFDADAGMWVDNSTGLIALTISMDGTEISGEAAALPEGANWGSISIAGANTITYAVPGTSGVDRYQFSVEVIPEPTSCVLLGVGGLFALSRRKRA